MTNISELTDYLTAVYDLEKQCYVLDRLIENEKSRTWPEIPMPPVPAQIPHTVFKRKSVVAYMAGTIMYALVAAGIAFLLFLFIGGYFLDQNGLKMSAIINLCFQWATILAGCILVGAIPVKIYGDRKDRRRHDKEQKEIDAQNEKNMALYHAVLRAREAKLRAYRQDQETSLSNLRFLTKTAEEKRNLLQQYYDLNIIYRQYRGLARISKYLEYFESGRCDTLKEAYNLCATENFQETAIQKMGIMITEMSQMRSELSGIRASNAMLYQALVSANENVLRIQKGFENQNQMIDGVNRQLCELKNNAQATAYFSETTARNSKLIADYAAYQDFEVRQKRLEDGHFS